MKVIEKATGTVLSDYRLLPHSEVAKPSEHQALAQTYFCESQEMASTVSLAWINLSLSHK